MLNTLYTWMIVISIASTVACLSALKLILITVIFIFMTKSFNPSTLHMCIKTGEPA